MNEGAGSDRERPNRRRISFAFGTTYLVTVSIFAAIGAPDSHRQMLYVAMALTLPFGLSSIGDLYIWNGHVLRVADPPLNSLYNRVDERSAHSAKRGRLARNR